MRAWSYADVEDLTGVVRHGAATFAAPPPAPPPALPYTRRWIESAACRGKPTGWWFPDPRDRFTAAVAMSVCRTCTVRSECLEAALAEETGQVAVGIRGGRTAAQRS